jgi:hypothetical protein
MTRYTQQDLQKEFKYARKEIKKEHPGKRLYFDTWEIALGEHPSFVVRYHVEGKDGEQYWNMAI